MPGLLRGDNDASELLGQIGNTLIEGQGGADILTDGEGNNLFSGGAGNDVVTGGDGNDLFVGGAGNDVINTGGGSNIVAFNAGSGSDTVFSDTDAQNTLSLGGGLRTAIFRCHARAMTFSSMPEATTSWCSRIGMPAGTTWPTCRW